MRALWLLSLGLVAGCAGGVHTHSLQATEAEALARKLANEKAETLYNCRPFDDGPPAQTVAGGWIWHDRKGFGSGDIEATVKFAFDGNNADVKVFRLYDQIR